ncbi:hypothetical protein Agub_g876, partial [Astrephomene gubernaculifera]
SNLSSSTSITMRCFLPNRLRVLTSPCIATLASPRALCVITPATPNDKGAEAISIEPPKKEPHSHGNDSGIRFVYEPPRRFVLGVLRKRRQSPPTSSKIRVDLLIEGNPLGTSTTHLDSLLPQLRSDAAEALQRVLQLKTRPEAEAAWKMPRVACLSLVLCDDPHIRSLNSLHRGKDAPTDVLSFELDDELVHRVHLPVKLMGDLVVSLDTAERQARERGHSLHDECRILLVHGLLHLVGWDHEAGREAHRAMAAAEGEVLAGLGWRGAGLIAAAGEEEEGEEEEKEEAGKGGQAEE